VCAPGSRCCSGHLGLRAYGRRPGADQRSRQPGRPAGRAGRVHRQLPRRATRLRRGLPGHRGRRGRLDLRAPRRPAA
jgi:hypothetical protein